MIVGSPDPKFYGGFSTDFSYKGVTLNAVFNYSCGGKKLSPYYESLITSRGTGIASIDLLDRWMLNFHVLFIMILQIPKRCITILFLPVKWIFCTECFVFTLIYFEFVIYVSKVSIGKNENWKSSDLLYSIQCVLFDSL